MKDSLTTFFIAFILGFIVSALTVKWEDRNVIAIMKDTWIHYGLFTTNGVAYGLSVMFGRDIYRYILIPGYNKIVKLLTIFFKQHK